jgi:hypothetical protein
LAGTIPLALSQQFDASGRPLAGGSLYIYQAGTVATPQNSYQDYGLTLLNPNPLTLDASGRIPMFWLADGLIHARLTDSSGAVVVDVTMQTLGPSSGGGGGGGGGSVDPTALLATGDFKWRPTSETLSGWVKANGQTIGSATSGASMRANADTQNLFTYLWNNFANKYCAVSGGRGSTAAADFAANKTIVVVDMRDRAPVGLDDMGNSAKGLILASNVTSSGDSATTPAATGGEANHTLAVSEAPVGLSSLTDPGHQHPPLANTQFFAANNAASSFLVGGGSSNPYQLAADTGTATTGITLTDHAGGAAHNNMQPFMLGTWYVKL